LHDSCVVLPVEINLQEVSREFTQLLTGKTLKRISEYSEDLFGTNSKFGAIDKDYLYKSYAENLAKISKVQVAGFQHGDLVLSNIFWDFRRETLKFIDPRATNSAGNLNLWGDLRYDLAKLFQSMFLGYELVIADRFALNSGMNKAMFEAFGEYEFIVNLLMIYNEEICIPLGVSLGEISAIANLLVIGLVPLHVDRPDRQKKFLEIIKNQKKWSEEFSN
jgi:hypothetical protein